MSLRTNIRGGGGGAGVLNNTTATTNPTVNDDSTKGYSVLSLWLNTATNEVFRALRVDAGNALWVQTTLTLDELGALAALDTVDTPHIEDGAVTLAKLQQIDTNRILGRYSASTGAVESLTAASVRALLALSASDTPRFESINLGHATDTTLTRSAAGRLAVEGQNVVYVSENREVLTADRTYYVRTDGSDSNSGGADDAGSAFLTIQKAIDTVAALDLSIFDAYIQIADGTYPDAIVLKTLVGAGTCRIEGNTATPASVLISTGTNNAITGIAVGNYHLEGVKIETTNRAAINIAGTLYLTFNDIDFGVAGSSFHLRADGNSTLQPLGNYEITGSAWRHLVVTNGGRILAFASSTITLTGTPAFATAFAQADLLSAINFNSNNVTFSGSATGKRFEIRGNSFIHTAGGGLDYLPGDEDGIIEQGSNYDDITVIDASGNNADGYYERNEHGKLEQWITTFTLTYLNGSICQAVWDLPTEFVDTDYVVIPSLISAAGATPGETQVGLVRAVSKSTTQVTIQAYRISGTVNFELGDTLSVQVHAVGRYE